MRQDARSLVRATTIPRRREDAEQFPILLNLQLRNQLKKNYGTKLKSLLTHGPKSSVRPCSGRVYPDKLYGTVGHFGKLVNQEKVVVKQPAHMLGNFSHDNMVQYTPNFG